MSILRRILNKLIPFPYRVDEFWETVIAGTSTSVPIVEGDDGSWAAQMGWRYVAYREGDEAISLSIEAMARRADLVYVPDAGKWKQAAPEWARARRAEILGRLKSIAWNRELVWLETSKEDFIILDWNMEHVIHGSVESTPGGQRLEALRLYNPGSSVPFKEVREFWNRAAIEAMKCARGRVRLFMSEVIPDSVFQAVILPTLRKNPDVELDFRND